MLALILTNHHTLSHTHSYTFSFGSNSHQQLAHSPSLTLLHSQSLAISHYISSIQCGQTHCLALGDHFDQVIRAFGKNSHGQLGDGTQTDAPTTLIRISFTDKLPEGDARENDKIVKVYANLHWSGALSEQGRVFLWGEAYSGNGDAQQDILSPSLLITQEGDDLFEKRVVEMALGEEHAILVDEAGEAYAMGYNMNGQTGVNDAAILHQLKPVRIQHNFPEKELQRVHNVAAGASTSFVVLRNGNVLCFGNAQDGICADGNTNFHNLHQPRQIEFDKFSLERVVQVVMGNFHAVARTDAGRLYAWGRGALGQLGHQQIEKAVASPVSVILPPHWEQEDVKIVDIRAFDESTLILLSDGRMGAFGDNNFGTLMHDILQPQSNVVEPSLVAGVSVNTFAMAQRIVFLATTDGGLYQVSGTQDYTSDPHLVYYKEGSHLKDVTINDVAGGIESTALITSKGEVITLGSNSKNELAAGDEESDSLAEPPFNNQRLVPRRAVLKAQHTFVQDKMCLSFHGLVINKDNEQQLFAWGDGTDYQLGSDQISSSDTIIQVPQASILFEKPISETIAEVACGPGLSGFVSNEGNAYTFGRGAQGLGDGSTVTRFTAKAVPLPTSPEGTKTFSKMSIGKEHFLLLTNDRQMYTFGKNLYDALGHPSVNSSTTPVLVEYDVALSTTNRKVSHISAGVNGYHNMAITDNRDVILCWGRNHMGQCGMGHTNNVPQAKSVDMTGVLQGKKFLAVAAGEAHSLILDVDGQIFTMGSNEYGALGVKSDRLQFSSPQRISSNNFPSDAPVRLIAAGARHSLAVLDYFACNSVAAFDPQVCSGHGKCSLNPTLDTSSCSCVDSSKWTGSNCEIPVCFSVSQTDTSKVCSGNGYCFQPDNCRCNKGSYGDNCENRESFCGTKCILGIIGLVIVAIFACVVGVSLILLVVITYRSSILARRASIRNSTGNGALAERYEKMLGGDEDEGVAGVELGASFGDLEGGANENDRL